MAMTLITTNTETNAASSSFTSGIDSTYKLYIFKFININPATNREALMFNGSIDGGSNYNVADSTAFFQAEHDEGDSATSLAYQTGSDHALVTGFQNLTEYDAGGSFDADHGSGGTLWLFNPSGTTYVKHFCSTFNTTSYDNYSANSFVGGYFKTASAIDAIQFKHNSGNFDGIIKMYGVG